MGQLFDCVQPMLPFVNLGDALVTGLRASGLRSLQDCARNVALTLWRRGNAANLLHIHCNVPG
jgi:hypothetical protein